MYKLLKNKKGLQLKSAFFAIIAIALVITSIGLWINEWNTTYSSGLVYDLDEYSELDEISGVAGSQQSDVAVKSTNTGEDFEGTSIRGVYGILTNIYAPFRIVFGDNGMLDNLTERFGFPDYVRQGLVTMMIIAITFTLVAILFRLGRTTA